MSRDGSEPEGVVEAEKTAVGGDFGGVGYGGSGTVVKAVSELPRRKGKPKYSRAVMMEVCDRLATSDFGLQKVLEEEPDRFPSYTVFYKWLKRDPELQEYYAEARELQGLWQGDKAVQEALQADMLNYPLAKLKFEARRWHAGKLASRVYGDSAQIRLANAKGDGDAAIRFEKGPLVQELLNLINVTPTPLPVEGSVKRVGKG